MCLSLLYETQSKQVIKRSFFLREKKNYLDIEISSTPAPLAQVWLECVMGFEFETQPPHLFFFLVSCLNGMPGDMLTGT